MKRLTASQGIVVSCQTCVDLDHTPTFDYIEDLGPKDRDRADAVAAEGVKAR